MPLQPISTLKGWFSSLKKPTQGQFWDWLDSFWHKSTPIPISAVDGLQDALDTANGQNARVDVVPVVVSGASTLTMSAESAIDDVRVLPSEDGNILIGTTLGGSEILTYPVSNGVAELISLGQYFQNQTTVHFTGNFTGKVKTTNYA